MLTDPEPRSPGAAAAGDGTHGGDPALDTVDWSEPSPGNLRVSYVLPSAGLAILASGVHWPLPDDPAAEEAEAASRHRLVWVDIEMPERGGDGLGGWGGAEAGD